MSIRDKKYRKCETCCPDHPVTFLAECSDALKPVWRCYNCGKTLPRRSNPQRRFATTTQELVHRRLQESFGGDVTRYEMIGGRLFVAYRNNERKEWDGTTLFGTIGARGKLALTLCRYGGAIEIDSWSGVQVYLQTP